MIALKNRLRLLAGGVRTGIWLRQAERAEQLALRHRNEIFFNLFRGAEFLNRIAAKRGVRRNDNAGGGADTGKLLNTDRIGQGVTALASHILRERDAHETKFLHLGNCLSRETLLLVDLLGQRLHFFFSEVTEQLSCHFLLFAQYKVHASSS